jgi:ornithine carbamoyltransferase
MARVFADDDVVQLRKYSSVPVISGLSDLYHPCQAVADFLTIRESFGELKGLPITYIGDGNNVAHSLAFATAKLGCKLTIITPEGYEPNETVMAEARKAGKATGADISLTTDPAAVANSKVVYTDTWASMGQEKERQERIKIFTPYQMSEARFAEAADDAIFLHCLPAHRGEEVVDAVADHPRSKIFDQAENRLHTQKAIMHTLMG